MSLCINLMVLGLIVAMRMQGHNEEWFRALVDLYCGGLVVHSVLHMVSLKGRRPELVNWANLILGVILGALRLMGHKDPGFQGIAHCFMGGLLVYWISYRRTPTVFWPNVVIWCALVVLEVGAFLNDLRHPATAVSVGLDFSLSPAPHLVPSLRIGSDRQVPDIGDVEMDKGDPDEGPASWIGGPTAVIKVARGRDAYRRVTAGAGDLVLVKLLSDPGSGHRWSVAGPGGGPAVQDGDDFLEPVPAGTITDVGQSCYQVFRFRVAGPGPIDLEYRQPLGDPLARPARTARIDFSPTAPFVLPEPVPSSRP